MANDDDRFGIQSVEIAGQILEAMTRAPLPIALRELARITDMPPGKIHRYLVSLTRTGIVTQDPTSTRYSIGPTAISLGLAGLRTVSVVRFSAEALPHLRDETRETALLAIWSTSGPIVVQLEESERPVFMNIRVGSILPMLTTATGKVFGAFLPKEDTAALLKAEQKSKDAGKQKINPEEVFSEVRNRGYAEVHGTLVSSVSAMAAPIFNHRGRISAVIGILGHNEDLAGPQREAAATSLLKVAKDISARLGHFEQTASS